MRLALPELGLSAGGAHVAMDDGRVVRVEVELQGEEKRNMFWLQGKHTLISIVTKQAELAAPGVKQLAHQGHQAREGGWRASSQTQAVGQNPAAPALAPPWCVFRGI